MPLFEEIPERVLVRMHPGEKKRYQLLKYIVKTACPGAFVGEWDTRDAFETFQAFATRRCGYAYVTYLLDIVQYLHILHTSSNNESRRITGFYFMGDGNIMLRDQPCHRT